MVGAGPAGATAAITLTRYGVDVLVVERRRQRSSLPRATAVSTRSMELMRSWGLESRVREEAVDVEWSEWVCETMAQASGGSAFPVGFPSRDQSIVVSPTGPACVPQDAVESALVGHLADLGVPIRLGTEVIGVENETSGVRVVVHDTDTGAAWVIQARYLVAADGAHSAVRSELGISMVGPDDLLDVVTAVFRAPLWELVGEHRYGIYAVTHPDAAGIFLPAGRGDRWVYGVEAKPECPGAEEFSEARLARLIRLAAGDDDLDPRIERIGRFSFAAQLAQHFRRHHTFLVGDAAHRVTPRGGTGMNSAIHGTFDLEWKLAWVIEGWAGPEMLDSYELERRPVVEHNLARSIPTGRSTRPTTASASTSAVVSRTCGCPHPSPVGSRRSTCSDSG